MYLSTKMYIFFLLDYKIGWVCYLSPTKTFFHLTKKKYICLICHETLEGNYFLMLEKCNPVELLTFYQALNYFFKPTVL